MPLTAIIRAHLAKYASFGGLARTRGEGDSGKTAIEMIPLVHPIPDHLWDRAAEIVLREIPVPNLLPELLNGRVEFEKRVVALVQGSQQP
jgi:hypothetical protein